MTQWQHKIYSIIKFGKTQADIARFCKTEDSTIYNLKTGKTTDPLYSTGIQIDTLMIILGLDKSV